MKRGVKREAERRAALRKGRKPRVYATTDHKRTGDKAALSTKEGLAWARTHLFLNWIPDPSTTSQFKSKSQGRSAREYAPIAPACMAMIEQACTDPAHNEEVQGSCSILVAMMSSSMRAEGASQARIPASAEFDGASVGVIEKDKHPHPEKRVPKVFVLNHVFIFSDDWHKVHTKVHEGLPCMSRATMFPGKPHKGGGWNNRALEDHELLTMLRWVLVEICGLTKDQSMAYSVSSLRKALPTICAARGCAQSDILDLGRWTGSWATRLYGLAKDMPELWERERKQKDSVEPYVKVGAAGRIRGIIRQNLDAVRTMIDKHGLENMPTTGGWESATWHALHAGHEAERPVEEVWAAPPPPRQPQEDDGEGELTEEWSSSDEGGEA